MDSTQGTAAPPVVWRRWASRSRATVAFLPGERRAAGRIAQRLFGRLLHPGEYAGLAGAPDDATVDVGASDGQIYLELRDPVGHAYSGYYYVYGRGAVTVLLNDGFRIHLRAMQRRGLGLQMFFRQVRSAEIHGIARIEALAGRRRDENGYYTWPRYGFDGPLPTSLRLLLPLGLAGSLRLLDVMSCETGREWWRENGTLVSLCFDLTRGSRSRQTLARYLRLRTNGGCGGACGRGGGDAGPPGGRRTRRGRPAE